MLALLSVIPVCIFLIVLIIYIYSYCKEGHRKKANKIPTFAPRKRASNLFLQTYQDGGSGANVTTSGTGMADGGTAIMAGAVAFAAVAALDGTSVDGGGGGNDGGGGGSGG